MKCRATQALELRRGKQQSSEQKAGQNREQHGGQQAPYSTQIEVAEPEGAGICGVQNQAGNQKTTDYKEDIDADEAAAESFYAVVVENNAENGYCTQPIDV